MSTSYEGSPTFEERVLGTPLIIDGKVEEVVDVLVDHSGDQPQVQTIFQVKIDDVLKGKNDKNTIKVRVVGGKSEKVETNWSINMKEGDRVFLMLSPDYGPDYNEDIFVPYFSSCYKITKKDEVEVDKDVVKDLKSLKIQAEKGKVKLTDLRSIIKETIKRTEKQMAALDEKEPSDFREMPYGEVDEMPSADVGVTGATSASPEDEIDSS